MQITATYNQPTPNGAGAMFAIAQGYAYCLWDRTLLLGSLQYNCRPGDDALPDHLMPIVDDALNQLAPQLANERARARQGLEHYLKWLERHRVDLTNFHSLSGLVETDGVGILQAIRRVKTRPEVRDILFQTHRIIHLPRPLRLCAFLTSRCLTEQCIPHLLSNFLRRRGMFDSEFERFYYLESTCELTSLIRSQCERLRPLIQMIPDGTTTLREIELANRASFRRMSDQLRPS